ncbi:hypothetical protein QQF64_017476 [Cirrhinus molitorella]|uniref:Ras-related protein Rab-39B n=1 Tax=Cirrhinus molitorella TaxID=172907 RepID=A0ABR3LMT5_9TELE
MREEICDIASSALLCQLLRQRRIWGLPSSDTEQHNQDQIRYGSYMAVPVPADCHWRLDDFFSRLVEIEPGKRIKLQIWDTAGQERFRSITRAYYRNSVGGLLLFDITNRRSFQNVHEWLEEARSHVQPHSIVFLLVGHKCDLEQQRQVSQQEAEKLAAAYGMRYVETSARDAINVERAFTELTRDIYELVKSGDITIQEGWEGVKSGFVPNVVHSSEEVTKSDRRCLC